MHAPHVFQSPVEGFDHRSRLCVHNFALAHQVVVFPLEALNFAPQAAILVPELINFPNTATGSVVRCLICRRHFRLLATTL